MVLSANSSALIIAAAVTIAEQHAFAFHYRLTGQRAEVTQAENGGAVRDNGNQVAFTRIFVGVFQILGDFTHWFCYTWAVGQCQIARSGGWLGQFYAQFAGTRMCVIGKCISSQVRHGQ